MREECGRERRMQGTIFTANKASQKLVVGVNSQVVISYIALDREPGLVVTSLSLGASCFEDASPLNIVKDIESVPESLLGAFFRRPSTLSP